MSRRRCLRRWLYRGLRQGVIPVLRDQNFVQPDEDVILSLMLVDGVARTGSQIVSPIDGRARNAGGSPRSFAFFHSFFRSCPCGTGAMLICVRAVLMRSVCRKINFLSPASG